MLVFEMPLILQHSQHGAYGGVARWVRQPAQHARATRTYDSGPRVLPESSPEGGTGYRASVRRRAGQVKATSRARGCEDPEKQGKNSDKTDWARRDSNPHPVLPEGILSPQRLPFRHSPNPCKHDTYDTSRCLSLSRVRKTSVWSRPSAD